jgi:hypothetical protein
MAEAMQHKPEVGLYFHDKRSIDNLILALTALRDGRYGLEIPSFDQPE